MTIFTHILRIKTLSVELEDNFIVKGKIILFFSDGKYMIHRFLDLSKIDYIIFETSVRQYYFKEFYCTSVNVDGGLITLEFYSTEFTVLANT